MESSEKMLSYRLTLKTYIRIARIDHWFKNVFMLPGIAFAWLLVGGRFSDILMPSVIALLSTGFIASANYVINEWLDAEFDRYHPIKQLRPPPSLVPFVNATSISNMHCS